MQIPKVIGADIELGNFLVGLEFGDGSGAVAARALLEEVDGVATGSISGPLRFESAARGGAAWNSCDWGRKYLPANGGCVYIDSNHLEVALPETRDAWSHVAHFHAMLRLVQDARRAACARLAEGVTLEVLANTSDGHGASYGAHLDFLIARTTFDDIFERKLHFLGWLASFQVSAIVLSGQGKAGAEHRKGDAPFMLSQRAEFFERLASTDTMTRRGIVNRRNEPLCGTRQDLARLHVIFFDDMLAHVARLVTVGSLQIALSMLEAGCARPDRILESPLEALHSWNSDPTLRKKARLLDGRQVTIVELQRMFFEDASRFVAEGRCEGLVPRAADIVGHWGAVLDALERRDLDDVATKLDWVSKLRLIEGALDRHPRLSWKSPQIKALDHLYASLGDAGVFLARDAAGLMERVVDESAIEHARREPPEDTRAWARAMLLRRWAAWVVHVDWDRVELEVAERWSRRRFSLVMDDPIGCTKQTCGSLFDEGSDLERVVEALDGLGQTTQPEKGRESTWSRDNSIEWPTRWRVM